MYQVEMWVNCLFFERERENQLWLPATRNTVDSKKLYWSNNIDPMMQNAYYGETLCYIIELPNAQVEFWRSTPCAIICIIVMGFLFRANWEHEKHYKMHTKRNNITITLFTTKFVSSRFVILPPWGKGTHPGFRELSWRKRNPSRFQRIIFSTQQQRVKWHNGFLTSSRAKAQPC